MADDEQQRLIEVLSHFQVAMLTTHAEDGELRGRPMLVTSLEGDGELVLCTRMDAAKVDEIEADPRCAVLMQGKTRWASLTGHARIERDRARIDALWREAWRAWFPGGKDDPQLALVVVKPSNGEYWDESGSRPLKFLAVAAESLLRGEPMAPPEPDQHGKVELG
jgi:general stress protein 26